MYADPRIKIIFALVLSTLSVFYDDPFVLLFIVCISLIYCYLFKANFNKVRKICRSIIFLTFILSIAQSIFTKSTDIYFTLFNMSIISKEGLSIACSFGLRMINIVLISSIICTSTNRELIQALHQWKFPPELSFMITLGIKFIPIFKNNFHEILLALQLRGISFKEIPWKQKLELITYLLFPVVVKAMNNAKDITKSIMLRAFRYNNYRTTTITLTLRRFDYVHLFFFIIIVLNILYIGGMYGSL